MRTVPDSLQTSLDSGATTLARCWRLTRRDGQVQGFTDHDRPLSFDGTTYEPGSGFTPTAIEQGTGLSAGTHDVTGALSSGLLVEEDIIRGVYDGAEIALWLVDWTDTDSRMLVSRGQIGAIRRHDTLFEAEVTGLTDRLNQPVGRAYLHACACRLGEPKCGVDLEAPAYRGVGSVSAVRSASQVLASGLEAFSVGWFTGGRLTWTTGANAGLDAHVKVHGDSVELWAAPPMAIAPGDVFEVRAGCDKTAGTCAARFDNLLNFRGFPHMPGDDVATSYPSTGGAHDGGSLYR